MNFIINTVMVICLLFSIFMLAADVATGETEEDAVDLLIPTLIVKSISVIGISFPLLYWALKLTQ